MGFAITAVFAWVTATVNDRNENRLLQEQVNEAGTVVAGVLPTLEIPMASATWAIGEPASIRWQSSSRPCGVRGALA